MTSTCYFCEKKISKTDNFIAESCTDFFCVMSVSFLLRTPILQKAKYMQKS